ncbi:cytochrome bd oxidase small subunit CydS [Paenibacillus eucommiae]
MDFYLLMVAPPLLVVLSILFLFIWFTKSSTDNNENPPSG